MDNRFEYALHKVLGTERARESIGVLSERTLHAVLKAYFEPHDDAQEVKIGGFVADIVGEDGIIEIQTKQLYRLCKKLEAFLACSRVTVVYPLIAQKYIVRLDSTGKRARRRKSPQKQGLYDAFRELYGIRDFLAHKNLTVCVCLLQVDELRDPNTKSRSWRGRAATVDTIPTALLEEWYFNTRTDYMQLIPDTLPDVFNSLEFAKHAGISRDTARHVLNTLTAPNIIKRVGKDGNNILFSVVRQEGHA